MQNNTGIPVNFPRSLTTDDRKFGEEIGMWICWGFRSINCANIYVDMVGLPKAAFTLLIALTCIHVSAINSVDMVGLLPY